LVRRFWTGLSDTASVKATFSTFAKQLVDLGKDFGPFQKKNDVREDFGRKKKGTAHGRCTAMFIPGAVEERTIEADMRTQQEKERRPKELLKPGGKKKMKIV